MELKMQEKKCMRLNEEKKKKENKCKVLSNYRSEYDEFMWKNDTS